MRLIPGDQGLGAWAEQRSVMLGERGPRSSKEWAAVEGAEGIWGGLGALKLPSPWSPRAPSSVSEAPNLTLQGSEGGSIARHTQVYWLSEADVSKQMPALHEDQSSAGSTVAQRQTAQALRSLQLLLGGGCLLGNAHFRGSVQGFSQACCIEAPWRQVDKFLGEIPVLRIPFTGSLGSALLSRSLLSPSPHPLPFLCPSPFFWQSFPSQGQCN